MLAFGICVIIGLGVLHVVQSASLHRKVDMMELRISMIERKIK